MKTLKLGLISALALSAAAPAFAQTAEAKAGVTLNVRDYPSEFATVVDVLDLNQAVTIEGCLEDVSWCKVSYEEMTGWASGQYLYVEEDAQPVSLMNQPTTITLETVTVTDEERTQAEQNTAAAVGATIGSLIAYAAGGPAGAIVASGILGTAASVSAVEPSEETITFVSENPVETVYLNGEVVVGAGVPEEVELFDVPSQPEFKYLVINGQPVLVDSETRVIAYVVR